MPWTGQRDSYAHVYLTRTKSRGNKLHLYYGTTIHHKVISICSIYIIFPTFFSKRIQDKTNAKICLAAVLCPQPCHCVSQKCHFQLFHVSLILWTPSEVYRSQLLHSADRNLACLWSDLVLQITWILRTVSCSTFTFSAQVFQSVLFLCREGPGHPSAQQHQGHCPGSSGCRGLPCLLGKSVTVCPDFCNTTSSSQTWHFWRKREGSFLRPFIYLS